MKINNQYINIMKKFKLSLRVPEDPDENDDDEGK